MDGWMEEAVEGYRDGGKEGGEGGGMGGKKDGRRKEQRTVRWASPEAWAIMVKASSGMLVTGFSTF